MPAISPRSILKHSSSRTEQTAELAAALPYPPPPPQVHFPPTPTLTQTYPTHSVTAYDRAPIVVLPNDCALPSRGCPGRTYPGPSSCRSKRSGSSSCSKSRSAEHGADGRISPSYGPLMTSTVPSISSSPPPLTPDVSSSESDESDGVVSPPLEYSIGGTATQKCIYSYTHNMGITSTSQQQLDRALSFLPYPPSLPSPKDSQKRDWDRRRRRNDSNQHAKLEQTSFGTSSLDGCLGGF